MVHWHTKEDGCELHLRGDVRGCNNLHAHQILIVNYRSLNYIWANDESLSRCDGCTVYALNATDCKLQTEYAGLSSRVMTVCSNGEVIAGGEYGVRFLCFFLSLRFLWIFV